MKKLKAGLLPQIIIAIIAGLCLGRLFPEVIVRIFITFNDLFSNFLNFSIPLIITGLVAPGIAEMGQKAGRALFFTVLLAYGSSVFSGFFTYFACNELFVRVINSSEYINPVNGSETGALAPYFSIEMLPVFNVMTALLLAFTVGVGCSVTHAEGIKNILNEFKAIIERLIRSAIIPLLPLYIFGIFLNMSYSGTAMQIISVFGKVIGIIFILHILLLLIQFSIAGIIGKKNPFRLLYNMLPAYVTALGTSSSAATIPVTLEQAKKNGVRHEIAEFCIPLCATIHLSGSVMKIVSMSLAICILTQHPHDLALYSGFIMMLGILMVAAPGVPGGAIMAAVGLLQSMLGFNPESIGLMIAIYIAIDSFGTACNVTGDGAIAVIIDKWTKGEKKEKLKS